ncbi:MAG: argininosuccinate synthase [Candidatus Gottesmanbacteria bacterium]|nr:argininosuccinate synthase [Candidatus Gottesmanbacteria bacterium]
MKKIVLAFSGGLDTSFCVPYLKEKGYEVYAATVDTGGFTQKDILKIKDRAKELDVKKHYVIDGKISLYDKIVSYVIKGNILRGGVYPLCAGPERIIQAIEVIKIAKKIGAQAVAHGSTGAGNDQVRFDVAIQTLAPELEIITPIRELGITRGGEVAFLEKHGIAVEKSSKDYSINKGMLGTTIGGKETKNSWELPPDEVYPTVVSIDTAPKNGEEIIISFEKGLPMALNGKPMSGIEIMNYLDNLGAKHGVGKGMHLGNTILGIKGRVVFEAPAALILIKAHKELEKLVLTKWQSYWKDSVSEAYGNFIHEGLYFDPVVNDIEAMIDSSQTVVTGDVKMKLHKGNIVVVGVKSPYSLMDKSIATYGEQNLLWTAADAAGFSKIYGLQGVLAGKAKTLGGSI